MCNDFHALIYDAPSVEDGSTFEDLVNFVRRLTDEVDTLRAEAMPERPVKVEFEGFRKPVYRPPVRTPYEEEVCRWPENRARMIRKIRWIIEKCEFAGVKGLNSRQWTAYCYAKHEADLLAKDERATIHDFDLHSLFSGMWVDRVKQKRKRMEMIRENEARAERRKARLEREEREERERLAAWWREEQEKAA